MWQWWFTDSYTPSKLQQLRHEVAKGHEKLVLSLWKETIIIYPANICNALTSCNNIEDLVEEYGIAPIFACIKQKNNNKMSVCLYLSHVDVTSGISAVRPHCNTEIKPSILRCFQGKQKWMNLLKLSVFGNCHSTNLIHSIYSAYCNYCLQHVKENKLLFLSNIKEKNGSLVAKMLERLQWRVSFLLL